MTDGMSRWPTRRFLTGCLLLAPALAGCGGGATTVKTNALEFGIDADQDINFNTNGEPSPILVRVYELKTKSAFEQASFFELLDSDTTKLGTELVGKREFEVKPGEKSNFKRDSPTDAKAIGVIAGFRDINTAQWRDSVDIVQDRNNTFVIQVTALAVKIALTNASRSFGIL